MELNDGGCFKFTDLAIAVITSKLWSMLLLVPTTDVVVDGNGFMVDDDDVLEFEALVALNELSGNVIEISDA